MLGSFYLVFIQICNSRKIHYLAREFRVKLHLKTDIAPIASLIAFRVQFNAEFPRQVMNLPTIVHSKFSYYNFSDFKMKKNFFPMILPYQIVYDPAYVNKNLLTTG